jgi:hypothetical protein
LVDTSDHSVGVDRSEGKRVFVHRPKTVGYRVKNISDEPVEMTRRIYKAKDEPDDNGNTVYECKDTEFVLNPGETVDVSKYDAGRLFGRLEFGFTAFNGYFTGSKGLETSGNLDEFYATRYFVPTTPLSERSTVIINAQVGMKDVSEEFLPVFAFLMVPKKPKRQKVSSRYQMESLALANYLATHSAPEAVEATSGAFDNSGLEGIATVFDSEDDSLDSEKEEEFDDSEENYEEPEEEYEDYGDTDDEDGDDGE